jgi:histidinol-phosphate aminotransferase
MPDRFNRRDFFSAGAAVTAAAIGTRVALALPAGPAAAAAPDTAPPLSVDDSPDLVRLSANENPYGPSPLARAALIAAAGESCRYPLAVANRLIDKLAAREQVPREQIVLGAGSSELLATLAIGYSRGAVVCAWPTFEQLPAYAERRGAALRKVPLDASLRHDLPALAAAITPDTSLLYVCNPNNPTGTVIAGAPLREFCSRMSRSTLVVVDEAYLDFIEPGATMSMVDLVRAGQDVVVLRTFSKLHGLAGLRLGYAVAPVAVARRLRELDPSLVPGAASLHAGYASLDDAEFLRTTRLNIQSDRRRIREACERLGLACADAQGNFVFFRTGVPIVAFRSRMRARRIEVGRAFAPYDEWCRVTVGTRSETDAFLAALPEVLKEAAA